MESFDNDNDNNQRQRLWGAAVFIAIMVIVLPLLLDGAGSESQFRRVEKLREEPPSIVDGQGNRVTQQIPDMRSADRQTSDIEFSGDDPPNDIQAERAVRNTLQQNRLSAPLTAWVVQAGSFTEQNNAVAMRDQLRQAGFASFVRDRDSENEPFRVLVGPMISEQSAGEARDRVVALLGRDATILSYP